MASKIRGFTLIELLIVVSIVFILLAVLTIDLGLWQRDTRVVEQVDRLLSDMEEMKLRSITGNPHAVFITDSAPLHYYQLHVLTDANNNFIIDGGEATPNVKGITGEQARGYNCKTPYAVLTPNDPANDSYCFPTGYNISWNGCTASGSPNQIWFDRKGVPRCDNWTVISPSPSTIRVWRDSNGNGSYDAGESNKTLIIDISGKIQYEK